jgi:hypothetical protein
MTLFVYINDHTFKNNINPNKIATTVFTLFKVFEVRWVFAVVIKNMPKPAITISIRQSNVPLAMAAGK